MCRKKEPCYCILLEWSVRINYTSLAIEECMFIFVYLARRDLFFHIVQHTGQIWADLGSIHIHSLLSASLSFRSCSCCTLHGRTGAAMTYTTYQTYRYISRHRHVTFVYICDITSDTSWHSTWLRCWSSSRLRAASSRAVRSSCCHQLQHIDLTRCFTNGRAVQGLSMKLYQSVSVDLHLKVWRLCLKHVSKWRQQGSGLVFMHRSARRLSKGKTAHGSLEFLRRNGPCWDKHG